jgi:8-oxo-dGTP diphosphatase
VFVAARPDQPPGQCPARPANRPEQEEFVNDNQPQVVEFTADVIVVREDGHVLLIRRGGEPFEGAWALPGGWVDSGETPLEAAVRELAEEARITVDSQSLRKVGVYDAPGRDPRGTFITTAYKVTVPADTTAQAGDDAAATIWLPTDTALSVRLAFDHSQILKDALGIKSGMEWGGR